MTIKIRGDHIIFREREYEVGELFSFDTIQFANEHAKEYEYDTCVVNELFGSYVLPVHNIANFLCSNKIQSIDISEGSNELCALIQCAARISKTRVIGRIKTFNSFISFVYKFESFCYLLFQQFRQTYKPIIKRNNAILFARSKATKSKFRSIDYVDKLFEDKPGIGSVYQQFPRYKRMKWLFTSVGEAHEYEKDMKEALKAFDLLECIPEATNYYSKRFIHTAFYRRIEQEFISHSDYQIMYTGNNLDRFAYNEEIIAKDCNKELRVIPHGIEYGYMFPKCFVGDVFYTCSPNAAEELNKLYGTKKFQFSQEIGDLMFKSNGLASEYTKVVYFTEPREHYVNNEIINSIFPILKQAGVSVYLKLHPIDKRENYQELFDLGIEEITDFQEAISGNICVGRKSTTLLEAIYNNSVAVAILINSKDKSVFSAFPSLQDSRISHFYDSTEAARFIVELFNKKNHEV